VAIGIERFLLSANFQIMIVVAELIVDWLKHAFITKFNEISAFVYRGKSNTNFIMLFFNDNLQISQSHWPSTCYAATRLSPSPTSLTRFLFSIPFFKIPDLHPTKFTSQLKIPNIVFKYRLLKVSRRMGFVPIPIAIMLIRVVSQSVDLKDQTTLAVLSVFKSK
jgi:hypothetical protein